jgi:hypothetical protein
MKDEMKVTLVSFHQHEPSPGVRVFVEVLHTCPFVLACWPERRRMRIKRVEP